MLGSAPYPSLACSVRAAKALLAQTALTARCPRRPGDNHFGQLGVDEQVEDYSYYFYSSSSSWVHYAEQSSPTVVSGVCIGVGVASVSLGARYTCAVCKDDTLQCWGASRRAPLSFGVFVAAKARESPHCRMCIVCSLYSALTAAQVGRV